MRKSIKRLARAYPRYLFVAIPIFAVLTISGCTAPLWPSWLFVPFCIAYAVLATIGSLYSLVVRRMHRQYKLNENGKFSDFNRRWWISLIVLFVMSLLSAFTFVLTAPSWLPWEWAFIWALVFLYYWFFHFARYLVGRQYASWFQKAAAMQWGFGFLMVVVCIGYAVITLVTQSADDMSLAATLLEGNRNFGDSSAALISEIDKLVFFSNSVVEYGKAQIGNISMPALFLIDAVSFAFVLFGLINLLNFCMLTREERKSVYRLLPENGELDATQPIVMLYIVTVIILSMLFTGFYVGGNTCVSKMRVSEGYTQIDTFLQERIQQVAFVEKYTQIVKVRDEQLVPLIDKYYDEAEDDFDSYATWYTGHWYEGNFGGIASSTQWLFGAGNDMARQAFFDHVAYVGKTENTFKDIQDLYKEYDFGYAAQLGDLFKAANSDRPILNSYRVLNQNPDERELDLWQPLQDDSGVDEFLFVSDDDLAEGGEEGESEATTVKDAVLANLRALIVASRADALAYLGIWE